MADKDDFKFDDDDAFPETDLSGAFSEGEQSVVTGGEPDYPMTIKKAGGSKLKLLLGLLLVVLVAGGGGYYYFVMSKPAPLPQSPPPRRPAAAAPKPATVPPPTVPAAPAAGQTQVAVPPPPAKPGASASAPAPVAAPAPATVAVAPPPKPAASVPAPVPAPSAVPAKPAVAVAPPPSASVPVPAPAPTPAPTPAPVAKPAAAKAAPKASGGPWMVEAGTYLNPADLKSAQSVIRRLGYEPKVSTMNKVVHMTRLRLGSYPEGEAPEALAQARAIAPDAFTLRSGSNVTLYAGTYADQQNVREMLGRLVNQGIQVEEEPVDVKRTISLLRFGGFASQSSADKAAVKARQAGLAAEVVKPH